MSLTKHQLMFALVGANRYAPAARSGGTAVCVLGDVRLLEEVRERGIVGPGSRVFAAAPDSADVGPDGVEFYDGAFAIGGDELRLGPNFTMQVVKYSVAEFLSLAGPTLVRIEDDEDFELFVADADRARAEGRFPGFLVSAPSQLGDEVAIGGDYRRGGPRDRLIVDGDGVCRTSARGAVIGTIDDGLKRLDATWRSRVNVDLGSCSVALDGLIDEDLRIRSLSARPWLPVYLDALAAQRDAAARSVTTTHVSGFGGTLSRHTGRDDAVVSNPVIAYNAEEALIFQLRTGTVLKTSTATARIVDAISRGGDTVATIPPDVRRKAESELARRGVQIEHLEHVS